MLTENFVFQVVDIFSDLLQTLHTFSMCIIYPGLSKYKEKAEQSAEYLKPLLEFAADVIPLHKHTQTPLYIMATAGMRLIDKQSVFISPSTFS